MGIKMACWSGAILTILYASHLHYPSLVHAQESSVSSSESGDKADVFPCVFRGTLYEDRTSFNIDKCTLCTCDNGTAKCNIESCPRKRLCKPSEYITIDKECCQQCPTNKVFVRKTKNSFDEWFPFTEGSSKKIWFGFNINVIKELTSRKIRGENMWKLSAWISKYENGTGRRFSEKNNVLKGKNRAKEFSSALYPPWDWSYIRYTMNFVGGTCADYKYFCIQFGLTAAPRAIYGRPIELQTVNNESNRLTHCVSLGECKVSSETLRVPDDARGLVEVFMDGYWGTICDTNWTTTDAGVVCRQLGFKGEFRVLPARTFQESSGPIHLSHVNCNGNETNLFDCQHRTDINCDHSDDVGVDCGYLSITSTEEGGFSLWVLAILPLVVIVVIAALIVIRKTRAGLNQTSTVKSPTHSYTEIEMMRDVDPILKSREIHPSNIELHNQLGRGKFGVVFRATLHNIEGGSEDMEAAVKTSNEMADLEEREGLLEEMKLMVQLGDHPDILHLLGCCSVREPYYLITAFMKYGDLLHFLRKCRIQESVEKDSTFRVGEKEKLMIALQIAKGMAFVGEQRFYHGDLAARNILVGEGLDIKISDFGLSEDLYTKGYQRRTKEQMIPIKWCSLETILHGICSSDADIWSYGVVLYEVYTLGGTPYPRIELRFLVPQLKKGYRMEQPAHCPDYIYKIMQRCWQEDPKCRMKFQEMVDEMDAYLVKMTDYVQFLSDDELMMVDDNEEMNGSSAFTGHEVMSPDDHLEENFAPILDEDDNVHIDDLQEFVMLEGTSKIEEGVPTHTFGTNNVYVES